MAASGACVAGLDLLAGPMMGPTAGSSAAQSPRRRTSWHGDTRGAGREERAGRPPRSPAGPALGRKMWAPPLPERGGTGRTRRMSTGGVRAEVPQVEAQRPMMDELERTAGRGMDEGAHGILDGGLEELPIRHDLAMCVGVHVCPHPDKVEKGGEDAYFVSARGGGVIGVADGVSGVAEDGIDPALYSRELMALAHAAAEALPAAAEDPRSVLEAAHAGVRAAGACTAVVAALEGGPGKLRVANLGDSGLRVLRGGRVCFATPVLQHFFDCPFQYGSESSDSTADAEAFEVQVQAGDCLVMGSDGLFDNMFDRDIEAVVSLFNDTPHAATTTAVALANLAKKHSMDADYESPYILEAIKEGYDVPFWKKMLGQKLTGGKKDDITVVVANIVAAPPHPSAEDDDADAAAAEDDTGEQAASPPPLEAAAAAAGQHAEGGAHEDGQPGAAG
ncbi:hypothetical protein KFL_009470050 [Klebsormidium nitens]|uniref:Protein phosphatase n=1 Tax=Klebsormidium nitens TaxID=105231 RepID=A0A1Y1ING8_KLENI|nr:hypothetical protein KFL_009470050 [Klebsormidium nitens]|eukprot:GAQ92213.1 hypothetical protein KFL_009470050 [Klebsormidium nitens]